MKIKIATDFATAPGPRHISEGAHSGEEFRKQLLCPKVRESRNSNSTLTIDLDGTSGYGTSFLEESFGGLIREDGFKLSELRPLLKFVSNEEPELLAEIDEYMEDAEKEKGDG